MISENFFLPFISNKYQILNKLSTKLLQIINKLPKKLTFEVISQSKLYQLIDIYTYFPFSDFIYFKYLL